MGLELKVQLLTSAAVVALVAAGPALAADLPLKTPLPVVAAWNWSGFYIGGHAGYGWGRDSFTNLNDPFFSGKFPSIASTGFDPKGYLGGLHAGANWQSRSIVAGLEADLSVTNIKGSSSSTTTFLDPFGSTNIGSVANSGAFDLLGSGRARLGYLITPNILLYGTGGLAWTRFVRNTGETVTLSSQFIQPAVGRALSTSTPTWQFGWVAGLGAETRLFDTNWLARLEYLHYDFGNTGSAFASSFQGVVSSRSSGDLTVDVVRAGLSYKFDPDRFGLGFTGAAGPAPGPLLYKAPPPAVLPWSWAGFYLGAHAGYGWASDPFNNLIPTFGTGIVNFGQPNLNGAPLSGLDSRGALGGFQAGANWQSGRVVGGLEIDLSGTGIKGSTSNSVTVPGTLSLASQTDKFDRLGSARARVGYLVTPSLLLYATGGPGWARLVTDQETSTTVAGNVPPTVTTSVVAPSWLFGWTAGVGVEARLWDSNWLARLEYLHYDFGSGFSTQTITVGAPLTATTSGHLTTDLVRAGLSYKFDWPGYAGGGASAMPVKAVAAAVWSWSGFYVGGHAGYGWGRDPFNTLVALTQPTLQAQFPPVVLNGVNSQGFVGGFQAGANWQAQAWVGGMEIDLSSGNLKGTGSITGLDQIGRSVSLTQTDKFDLLGSARARLGYLVWPNVLLYGTGGLAWTRLEQTATSHLGANFFTADTTTITTMPSWRFGWVAGAGGEARLWNTNWLARLEYLHYDFGTSGNSLTAFTTGGAIVAFIVPTTTSRHSSADIVRAGFGYKFD